MFTHAESFSTRRLAWCVLAGSLALSGCGLSPKAAEHSGEWKKVNAFSDDIQVIPLQVGYVYSALRIDTSLHQMLERWARDTGLEVDLRCVNDYSLPGKLLQMKAHTLKLALQEINQTYARQEVRVSLENGGRTLQLSCDVVGISPAASGTPRSQNAPALPATPARSPASSTPPVTPHFTTPVTPAVTAPVTAPVAAPAALPSPAAAPALSPPGAKPMGDQPGASPSAPTPDKPTGSTAPATSNKPLTSDALREKSPISELSSAQSPAMPGLLWAQNEAALPQGFPQNGQGLAVPPARSSAPQPSPLLTPLPKSPVPSCAVLTAPQRSVWGKGGAQANRVQTVKCQTSETLAWRQD